MFHLPLRAALALLLLLVVPLGCAQTRADSGDIVIGAIGAMTGPSADLGNNLRQGLELALDEINGSGGVNGRKLRVVFRDDEADPRKAVAALQELVTKEKIVALIAPTNTASATALLPYVQEARIVHINGGATGSKLIDHVKYPHSFRTIYSNEIQATEMAAYAVKVRGWQKIAVLHDKTALGVDGGAELLRALRDAGVTPVAVESYNVGDSDLTPYVARISRARPEAILSWALGVDTARLLRSMQAIGFEVPYVNYSGGLLRTTRDFAGDAIRDAMAVGPARFAWRNGPGDLDPAVMRFIEMREKKFGADDKLSIGALACQYDALMLLADAIKLAGSTDRDALCAALESIKGYQGVATEYSFGPDDHEGFDPRAMGVVYIGESWKGSSKRAPLN